MSPSSLSELRLKLVASREDLHEDEATLVILEAKAEQEIIFSLGDEKALGSNAEARKRALTIRLAEHRDYQDLMSAIRHRRSWNEELQAKIDNLLDERKEREIRARERLTAVIAAAYGVTVDDGQTDAVVEAEAIEALVDGLPGVPAEDDSVDIEDEPIATRVERQRADARWRDGALI